MIGSMLNFHYSVHLVLAAGQRPQHVIDVGLYQGLFMDFWKHAAQRVTAFEPNRVQWLEIEHEYIRKQPREEQNFLSCYNLGISDFIGKSNFYRCIPAPAYSTSDFERVQRLVENKKLFDYFDFERLTIQMRTLDDLIAEDTNDINIVKVDSEHNDLLAVKGAKKLIMRNRPLLQLEHIRYTEAQCEDCDSLMEELEYTQVEPTIETDNHYFVPKEWNATS